MEIERKWLVDEKRCPGFVLYDAEILETEQGYLNTVEDQWLIRLRKVSNLGTVRNPLNGMDKYHFLELKTQGLLSREEIRYYISGQDYEDTIGKCNGLVRKTRYCWNDNGVYFEVDKYKDHDFVTCEVEFKSEEEANNFVAPDWCIKDVTYDPSYKNVNLAV